MNVKRAPWLMLFSRIALFFLFQALVALLYFISGSASAWEDSADWWLLTVPAANIVCIILLVNIFRAEGSRYWDLFRIDRKHILGDVLIVLASFAIGGPASYFPNVLLGGWLFGDPNATLELFVRPLPMLAVFAGIFLFPITQGLAELPTYFGYVMPRFESGGMNKILAVSLPALMLGLQHVAVPLLLDMRFIAWRALMYIPFAFFSAILLHWRPRLLPYMAIIHILMNMSFATMFLQFAY